ncbi:hypothetical protein FRB90_007294 [Tulasnella sp. 427]|nr:hypothetical protein FRB90_007294 [Tulasnella sp. 427]
MPRPAISGPLSVTHSQLGAYDNYTLYDSRYGQYDTQALSERRSRQSQRPHHDSYYTYERPQQSTSSRYSTDQKALPARKRTRFAVDSNVSQDWVCTRTPISPIPATHSEHIPHKTRPLPTPLQTPYTSSSRTLVSQQTSARTLVDSSVRVPQELFSPTRRSPTFSSQPSPFSANKPLPTPPKSQTFSITIESLYEEQSNPSLTSTPESKQGTPHIIRTQTQSYSFGGSLKAIWKKTTAQIRVVRQAGLTAIMTPAIADRDSVLWSGFSKVPMPPSSETSEDSSIRTRSSKSSVRSSGWWRTREIAIVESSERLEMMSIDSGESGSYRTARTRRSSESQSSHMIA